MQLHASIREGKYNISFFFFLQRNQKKVGNIEKKWIFLEDNRTDSFRDSVEFGINVFQYLFVLINFISKYGPDLRFWFKVEQHPIWVPNVVFNYFKTDQLIVKDAVF